MSLTFKRAMELLDYDPSTGVLVWRVDKGRIAAGTQAGTAGPSGYRFIKIDQQNYSAHRVAWLIVYGEWPADQIDHRNGRKDDNRLSNLRVVDNAANNQNNARPRRDSTSGLRGVCRAPKNRWRATIQTNGRQRYLGAFDTPERAHLAYLEAKMALHEAWATA